MAPQGKFDIVGNRCIGSVGNDSGKPEEFEVMLKRKGYVIASQVVESSGRQNLAPFSFDCSGVATGGDFAREHVLVSAVDAYGAIGRLSLDSTTQIDLIQQFMGRPEETLLELNFPASGNAGPKLGVGWSRPEAIVCCTEGNYSEVMLDCPASLGVHELILYCSPFLSEPLVKSQRCSVCLDNEPIGFFIKNHTTLFVERIKVPAPLLAANGRKVLGLHHPDAARPKDVSKNPDSRTLAFFYKKLLLTRPIER